MAQPILKEGCYWRVGNGASIWVLKDCWLPNQPTKKILFQLEKEIWEWRVSNLIAWPNHQWDKERINAIFHPFDADANSPSAFEQVGGARCGDVVWFKKGKLYSEVQILCGKAVTDGREQPWGVIEARNEWGTLVTYLAGQCS